MVRAGRSRGLVQILAFVRKELVSLLRQPRLLVVLVVGPFLLLLLFGLGYDQQSTVLRTEFVGPADSVYEEAIDEFADELERYVTYEGYGTDVVAAEQRLADGEIDAVVIFPPEPARTVADGEQAVITVLHNKIDPIQQTAVEVSAEVAVRELNSTVLERVLADVQGEIETESASSVESRAMVQRLEELGGEQLREAIDETETGDESAEDLTTEVDEVDPAVVVRPFVSDTESLLRDPLEPNDFFAPAAIALLLQHMALTFAAMGLVKDRGMGLFELFKVGPVGPGSILFGKSLAYLVVCAAVGGALLAAVVAVIGVPFRGEIIWAAAGLFGLIVASIAWGTVLSLLARTDTQAVQYAMLALLAGLFFGGFLLDLDAIRYPVRLVSFIMPVTYATRLFRDVMLRGVDPALLDLVGLVAITAIMAVSARLLMGHRLKVR